MGRRIVRCAAVASLALAGLAVNAQYAFAQPSNDDFANATSISSLPFSTSEDTSTATTAVDDPDCAGNGASVWFSFTPTSDTGIEADTFGSDYDTTLSAYTGTQGALNQVACDDDAGGTLQSQITFTASAGVTYFFMAAAYDSGGGGNLVFNVNELLPPATIAISIDSRGSVTKSGTATITGTVTCSRQADASVSVDDLKQVFSHRFVAEGSSGSFSTGCSPSGTHWSAAVSSSTSVLFGPGSAQARASAVTCTDSGCNSSEATKTVKLRTAPSPVIQAVTFSGSSSSPTVSVKGAGFGASPPAGYDNTDNFCGSYPNNGNDYGDQFSFTDNTNAWSAGQGIPPGGSCIGLVVQSWKTNAIVFTFGSAYGSFDHWTADQGDSFTLTLEGGSFTGTVNYPA